MAPKSDYYVGFDLGGTKMRVVVVDDTFKERTVAKTPTKSEEGAEAGLKRMRDLVDEALEKADVSPKRVKGFGFGLPGLLDFEGGRIVRLLNVGWTDVPVREVFEKAYGCPVAIENDVNAGTYGEYRLGAGKGHKDLVGIFPGTGIGGGVIIDGRLHHGVSGGAGEIGHLVYDSRGGRCGCGKRGCYEVFASRVAIAGRAAEAVYRGQAPALRDLAGTDLKDIRSGKLAKAIKKGDKVIEEIVREAAYIVGQLAGAMVVTLSPSRIVLGGGLVEAMEDIYLKECSRAMDDSLMPEMRKTVDLAAAKLGDDAVTLGAAALAADLAAQ